ncbi:FliG C-terminal domain-containing protein [candidate division KSB1 bacterium]
MAAKIYKVKNPKTFIFSQIFFPNPVKNIINSLKRNTGFGNPVLRPSGIRSFAKLEKGYIGKVKIRGKIGSIILIYFPKDMLKQYNLKRKKGINDFVSAYFDNTVKIFSMLFDSFTDYQILKLDKFKQKEKITKYVTFLRMDFPLTNRKINNHFSIYMPVQFIKKMEKYFIKEVSSSNDIVDRAVELDEHIREYIKARKQTKKDILKTKFSEKESFKTEFIEFNELVLLSDPEIRILLEELINRRFTDRELVLALSSSSDELRTKFLKNMSRNRRKELSENFFLIEGQKEEKLRVQKEVLYILVDMINKNRIKFKKEIEEKLVKLSAKLKKEAAAEAISFLESGTLRGMVEKLNNRQMQLLVRRVGRKSLILGLIGGDNDIKRKFVVNMNDEMLVMVKEDVNYWKKQIPDIEELRIFAASAQKEIVGKVEKIIEEDRKLLNIRLI